MKVTRKRQTIRNGLFFFFTIYFLCTKYVEKKVNETKNIKNVSRTVSVGL